MAETTAPAQDDASRIDHEPAVLEHIVVTGTRLQAVDLETSLPISVIGSDYLASTGDISLAEALRTLPYNNLGAAAEGIFAGARLSFGFVDLRGLGPQRTLVLVNGRRPALSAQTDGEAFNLNNIPLSAVDRVEVLRDGASAVYGSDAIGGVVNVILRQQFEGWQVHAGLAESDDGGADERYLALTGGLQRASWGIDFAAEHTERDPVLDVERNRDGGQTVVYGNPVGDPGTWFAQDWFGDGTSVPGPLNADPACPQELLLPLDDWAAIHPDTGELAGPESQSLCSLLLSPGNEFSPEVDANRLYFGGHRSGGRGAEFTFSLLYSELEASMQVTTGGALPDLIDAGNPVNPGYDPSSGGAPWPVSMYYGLHQLGDRVHAVDSEYLDGAGALLIPIGPGELEFAVQYGQEDIGQRVENLARVSGIRAAIDQGRFDPFAAENDPLDVDGFRYTQKDRTETRQWGADFTWRSEFLPGLTGHRPVAYAAGVEYRREEFAHVADPANLAEDVFGWFPGDYSVDAGRGVTSAFFELEWPLGDPLSANYAGRYDAYSEPDAGEFTNKLSLRWHPGEAWVFRAGWGQGFRAPSLFEIAAPRVPSLAFGVFDTLRCASAGGNPLHPACFPVVVRTSADANPDLQPETSTQWSAGLAWQPTDTLHLTLDFWDIEVSDQIDTLPPQVVLDLEAFDALPPGSFVERTPAGTVVDIVRGRLNLPAVATRGADFEARWELKAGQLGAFGLFSLWSYLDKYEVTFAPEVPPEDFVGLVYLNGGVPEWKTDSGVDWSQGPFRANVTVHGADAYFDPEFEIRIDAFWSYDLAFGWETSWGGDLSAGVRNLTDERPIDPWLYYHSDYVGRMGYLRYRQDF